MDARGWRASVLAEKTGLDPGSISKHRKQEHAPLRETVDVYEAALGVVLVPKPPLPASETAPTDGLTPNKRLALARLGEEADWENVPPDQYEYVHNGLRAIHFSSGLDADPGWLLAQARRLLREAQRGEMPSPASPTPPGDQPSPERKAQMAAKKTKRKR